MPAAPALVTIGDNPTPIWGMTNAERMRRIAAAQRLGGGPGAIVADLAFAVDPAWIAWLKSRPGTAVTLAGRIVLAHVDGARADAAGEAMREGNPIEGVTLQPAEDERGIYNEGLRKRERPFVLPLTPL